MIKVIAKTFEVLETLNREPNLSLKEITERVEYPKPTVFRLLNTLSSLGYVEQDYATQTFTLSSKFFSFNNGTARGSDIITSAQPYMEELQNEFKETVNLARLVDNTAVYVNVLESNQLFRICNSVGDHAALHSTAVGKAILAFLPDNKRKEILKNYSFVTFTKKTIKSMSKLKEEIRKVKKQGYALDNEEGHDGVICIGAPIFNKDRYAFAAISVSMPKVRAKKTILDKLEKKLPLITEEISSKLNTNYVLLHK
jgi:IclR family acetate operon transcriptional repressor